MVDIANDDNQQITNIKGDVQVLRYEMEGVLSSMKRMQDLMGTMRDFTRDEVSEMKAWKEQAKSVSEMYQKMYPGELQKGSSPFTAVMRQMERDMQKYTQLQENIAAQQAAKESEIGGFQEQRKTAARRQVDIETTKGKIEGLLGGRITKATKAELKDLTGSEETSAAKLRSAAKTRLKDLDKEKQLQKDLMDQLGLKVEKGKQELVVLKKRKEEADKNLAVMKDQYDLSTKTFKMAQNRFREERERGGGGGYQRPFVASALDVARDLNLPGVAPVATVARYAQKSVNEAPEDSGMMSNLLRLLGGATMGAGVVAGGYTALQGYRSYQMAKQLAPGRVALGGMLAPEDMRQARRQITDPRLLGMGFNPLDTLAFQQQVGRGLGAKGLAGEAGRRNIEELSRLERVTGIGRGELLQQATGMVAAGAGRPQQAAESLRDVLTEGVKAGVDASKLTDFTQTTLGLQEELLRLTGQNNIEAISKTIGAFIREGLRQGTDPAAFLRGPEMGAARNIDQALKQASRGGLAPQAMGTLTRAFGFGAGAEKGTFGSEYYDFVKKMEGGIFGMGSSKEQIEALRGVFGQYVKETGGEQPAAIRMKEELGVSLGQFEKMTQLLKDIQPGAPLTKQQEKMLSEFNRDVGAAAKTPEQELLSMLAKQEALLATTADTHLPEVISIERMMLEIQTQSHAALTDIVSLLKGQMGISEAAGNINAVSGAMVGGAAVGLGAYALKKAKGLFSGASKAVKGTSDIPSVVKTQGGVGEAASKVPKAALPKGAATKALPAAGKAGGRMARIAKGFGKVGRGAGKIAGKLAVPLAAGLTAYEGYELATMSPEERKKRISQFREETSKGNLAEQALAGLSNPITAIMSLVEDASDIFESLTSKPEFKTGLTKEMRDGAGQRTDSKGRPSESRADAVQRAEQLSSEGMAKSLLALTTAVMASLKETATNTNVLEQNTAQLAVFQRTIDGRLG